MQKKWKNEKVFFVLGLGLCQVIINLWILWQNHWNSKDIWFLLIYHERHRLCSILRTCLNRRVALTLYLPPNSSLSVCFCRRLYAPTKFNRITSQSIEAQGKSYSLLLQGLPFWWCFTRRTHFESLLKVMLSKMARHQAERINHLNFIFNLGLYGSVRQSARQLF